MTDLRQAAQQALDALENGKRVRNFEGGTKYQPTLEDDAITTLRSALEQQAEPVAWQVMVEDEAMKEFPIKDMAYDWCIQQKLSGSSYVYWMRPLYTTPPQRQWVGLTDEEKNND